MDNFLKKFYDDLNYIKEHKTDRDITSRIDQLFKYIENSILSFRDKLDKVSYNDSNSTLGDLPVIDKENFWQLPFQIGDYCTEELEKFRACLTDDFFGQLKAADREDFAAEKKRINDCFSTVLSQFSSNTFKKGWFFKKYPEEVIGMIIKLFDGFYYSLYEVAYSFSYCISGERVRKGGKRTDFLKESGDYDRVVWLIKKFNEAAKIAPYNYKADSSATRGNLDEHDIKYRELINDKLMAVNEKIQRISQRSIDSGLVNDPKTVFDFWKELQVLRGELVGVLIFIRRLLHESNATVLPSFFEDLVPIIPFLIDVNSYCRPNDPFYSFLYSAGVRVLGSDKFEELRKTYELSLLKTYTAGYRDLVEGKFLSVSDGSSRIGADINLCSYEKQVQLLEKDLCSDLTRSRVNIGYDFKMAFYERFFYDNNAFGRGQFGYLYCSSSGNRVRFSEPIENWENYYAQYSPIKFSPWDEEVFVSLIWNAIKELSRVEFSFRSYSDAIFRTLSSDDDNRQLSKF